MSITITVVFDIICDGTMKLKIITNKSKVYDYSGIASPRSNTVFLAPELHTKCYDKNAICVSDESLCVEV